MTGTTIRTLFAAVAFVGAFTADSAAQIAVTVSGRVTSDGAPVAGARVRVDVTPVIERVTNADGRYSLIVPSSNVRGQSVTMTASFSDRRVRYEPKSETIVLSGGAVVRDFVLTKLSGDAPPTSVPGATGGSSPTRGPRTQIVPSDSVNLIEIAGAVDLASALAGRVPGLNVSTASTPGGSASLVFRGPRSILGSSQPLYVVDGTVLNTTVYTSPAQRFGLGGFDYGSALSDLDIADVATVQFISGPEAAARFGGRGANGVVYVRTKNGTDGPRLGVFSSFQSVNETFTRLPSYQNQFGQGLNGQFDFFNGRGGGVNDDVDQSWGPALDGRAVAQASYQEAGRPDVRLWSPRPNNVRNYFADGRTTNVMAGVQGHADIGSFRVFGGTRSTSGITPDDEVFRRNVGAHATLNPVSRLQLAVNAFATEWKTDDTPGSGFNEGNPVSMFTRMGRQVDTDSLRRHLRDAQGRQISWSYTGHNNPYFATLVDSNRSRRYHIAGGGSATYALAPWLTATAHGGTDYLRDHRLFYIASGWMGGFPSYTGPGDFSKGGGEGNEVFVQQTTSSLRFDAVRGKADALRWTFSGGADLIGTRERIRTLGVDSARHVPSAGAPDTARLPSLATWTAHSRQTAAFGEIAAVGSNGATLNVGVRNAWTSAVPGQSSSDLLPSLRGTVDLVRAVSSLKDNALFNAVTLRAAWWRDAGDLSPYVTQTMYAGRAVSGNVAPLGGALLVADTSLSPEITSGWQVGGDFTLRSRRITVGFTLYGERTSDVILPVSNTALGTLTAQNVGQVSNTGIEGSFATRLGNGDFGLQWDLGVTAGKNSNAVDALSGGLDAVPLGPSQAGVSVEARRGQPLGALMGTRLARDGGTGALLLRNGLPFFAADGAPQLLGTAQPSSSLGVRSSLRYRWVTASAAADGRFGGSVFSLTNQSGTFAGTLATTAFRPDSGLLIAGIDVAGGRANTTHVSAQDYYHALASAAEPWVYSASYFKLRDARVTVAIPVAYGLLPFESASVSLVMRNAWTWSKAPNVDPETVFSPYQLPGVEMGQLPAVKSVGFQVTITP